MVEEGDKDGLEHYSTVRDVMRVSRFEQIEDLRNNSSKEEKKKDWRKKKGAGAFEDRARAGSGERGGKRTDLEK